MRRYGWLFNGRLAPGERRFALSVLSIQPIGGDPGHDPIAIICGGLKIREPWNIL
jgi:hypothetical protein